MPTSPGFSVQKTPNQASNSMCNYVVVCIGRVCSTGCVTCVTLFVPSDIVPLLEGSMADFGAHI